MGLDSGKWTARAPFDPDYYYPELRYFSDNHSYASKVSATTLMPKEPEWAMPSFEFSEPQGRSLPYSPGFEYENPVTGLAGFKYYITGGTGIASIDTETGVIYDIKKVGTIVVTAIFPGNEYFPPSMISYTIAVYKPDAAFVEMPQATPVWLGDKLSASILVGGAADSPGHYEWQNPNMKVSAAGAYSALFIPENQDLYDQGFTVPVQVDTFSKTELLQLISRAKQALKPAVIGYSAGQYTPGAAALLSFAIETAENFADAPPTTTADIEDMADILDNALKNFLSSKNKLNLTGLLLAILNGDAAIENGPDGAALDNLKAAVDQGITVYEKSGATQAEVDAAVSAITSALGALDAPAVKISLSNKSIIVGGTARAALSMPGALLDASSTYSWSVLPASVATIDVSSGSAAAAVITGVGAGEAIISCSIYNESSDTYYGAFEMISVSPPNDSNAGSDGGGSDTPGNPSGSFLGGSSYTQGAASGLIFIVQKDFALFDNVKVGNTALVRDRDYKAEDGSTRITLLPAYLDTLKAGTYTLSIGFKDGTSAAVNFTVGARIPFEDVKESDWFFDAVMQAYENGLMTGTSKDPMLFSPKAALTRGMAVTILYRMQKSVPYIYYENPFDDVNDNAYYTDAVKWAYHNSIVSGYGNGKFGPHDNITREQMALILLNYQLFSSKIPMDVLMDREFSDWNDISDWAKNAVNRLTIQGIISGKPGNLFDPKGNATRAEFATVLMRFMEKIE